MFSQERVLWLIGNASMGIGSRSLYITSSDFVLEDHRVILNRRAELGPQAGGSTGIMTNILEPVSRNDSDGIKGWGDNKPGSEQALAPRLARGRTSPAKLAMLFLLAASCFHSFLTLPVNTPPRCTSILVCEPSQLRSCRNTQKRATRRYSANLSEM